MTLEVLFFIIALVFFLIASTNYTIHRVNALPLGLVFLTAGLLAYIY